MRNRRIEADTTRFQENPNGQTRVVNAHESANPYLHDSLVVNKYHDIRKHIYRGVNYRKVIYKNY